MKRMLAIVSASICAALSPAVAGAQASDSWQFGAAVNVYLPTIKGTTTFAGNGGAGTDILYLHLGNSKAGTRDVLIGGTQLPAGASANANLDIRGTVWTLAVFYRALAKVTATRRSREYPA